VTLSVEVRGELDVTCWRSGFDWLAHDHAVSWVYGSGRTPMEAVCQLIRVLAWERLGMDGNRYTRRRVTDAFRVIRDQQQHIRSLEAQLLPNLVHEVVTEQEALL
jgi:hypothetical protein